MVEYGEEMRSSPPFTRFAVIREFDEYKMKMEKLRKVFSFFARVNDEEKVFYGARLLYAFKGIVYGVRGQYFFQI